MAHPGLAGLNTSGKSHPLNSLVQCLSNTTPLVEFFLSDAYVRDINRENPMGARGEVAIAFATLVKSLWTSKTPVSSSELQSKLEGVGVRPASDANELFAFLLDSLHEDLNRIKKRPYATPNENLPEEELAEDTWRIHKLRNDSIIVDLFHGESKQTVICPTQHPEISFSQYSYLPLSVSGQGNSTLEKCVEQYTSVEEGPIGYYCKKCRAATMKSTYQRTLWRTPSILVVALNKLDKQQELVNYPITGWSVKNTKGNSNESSLYDLYGVVMVSSDDVYSSYVWHKQSGKWYHFADSSVEEVNESQLVSPNATMLFYRRRGVF